MGIGIDPTVDFAFKKLLGSPDHPAVTLPGELPERLAYYVAGQYVN